MQSASIYAFRPLEEAVLKPPRRGPGSLKVLVALAAAIGNLAAVDAGLEAEAAGAGAGAVFENQPSHWNMPPGEAVGTGWDAPAETVPAGEPG